MVAIARRSRSCSVGIRKRALRGIRLGDYDGEHLRIATKGGKRQILPVVDPWLKAILDQHWEERPVEAAAADRDHRGEYLLYPARDVPRRRQDGPQTDRWEDREKPMSDTSVHRWWGYRIQAAGVPYRRLQSTRHTRLTEIVRSGRGGLKIAQLLAGHESIQTTGDIYGHADMTDVAEALRLLAANCSVPPEDV